MDKWKKLDEKIRNSKMVRVSIKGSMTAILRDKDGNIKEIRECEL